MLLPPERIDATHDIIYLAKHPLYEFVLEKSPPITPELRSQPSLVQLRFTGHPQQEGVKLPLAALEQLHDALSRLLDYIKQERARGPAITLSGSSLEGSMAPTAECRHHSPEDQLEVSHPVEGSMAPTAECRHHPPEDQLEVSHPTAYSNRPVSVERLCNLSGIVLTGLIALLSWALYSLSASKVDFRPLQATAAQQALPHASTLAMSQTNDEAGGMPARTVVGQPLPSGASSAAKAQDEPPHIYLHIQSPAQHDTAQRLVQQLQQKGYVIPRATILVSKGPSRTEVRYFSPAEAEEATAIAMLLDQPYRPPATSRYIRGRKDTSQTRPRHYEVWLGPEPRSRRIVP